MNSARLMPWRATVGLVFITCWTGASRSSPRNRPRRISPSVTVPTRCSRASTTRTICSAVRSSAVIACRIDCSLVRIPERQFFMLSLSLRARCHAGAGWNIAGDDRASTDHGLGADPDALNDDRPSAEMTAVADLDHAGKDRAWRDMNMIADAAVMVDAGRGVNDTIGTGAHT